MAKIGIYGGSFNPPHIGHIRAAVQCKDALGLDRVLLIPAAIPPHKRMADGSPDGETRLRMTQLAFAGLSGFEVSDIELHREGKSYTVDTMEQLRETYPDDELYLMMGTDMFLTFDKWYRPERIAQLAKIVCFSRVEEGETLRQQYAEQCALLRSQFGCEPILLHNEVTDISSTEIRRLLFFRCADRVLPESVLREIGEKGLYGTGKDCRGLPTEELKELALSLLKPVRVPHVEGVCKLAAELARKYGEDADTAIRAAALHDVTKALTPAQQLWMCEAYHIPVTEFEKSQTALLHAMTAETAAREIFGEREEICSAIRWHTTGRAGMTTLEKIIYIADMAEESREFPGVDAIRAELNEDLDAGVRAGLWQTITHLREKGRPVSAASEQALTALAKG